ncbi:MAG: RtcB family protein [Ardenticatenaceae bacterium]|nr:RtcB family protein [Ardenticatenaceae bacterium]
MVKKSDLKRVGEYVWEIPASFRSDMRVPARVYASEEVLAEALDDKSLEQLVNASTLPGVVQYTIAMPDVHQGYGFPVGGVAATRLPDGIISPGAIGYDINCLSGDSRILHTHGYTWSIAEMETTWQTDILRCQRLAAGCDDTTAVVRYLTQPPRGPVYRLTTTAGDEIVATADHPFWTPDGMVALERLAPGDRVACYPFEGVPYEDPGDTVLVDEEDIARLLSEQGKGTAGNVLGQLLAQLRRRDLLPLRADSPKLPHLIKILGYLVGGGHLFFGGGPDPGMASFYGDPAELEQIRADVSLVGFSPSPVHVRSRRHRISAACNDDEFDRVGAAFTVGSTAFVALLVALGAPVGARASQAYRLPSWLFAAPRWQQRLFLAALFGAELSAPQASAKRRYNFDMPVLSLNKPEGSVEGCRQFLEELAQLLEGFGVETRTISQRTAQVNVDGTRSYRLRLILSSQPESLINLWSRIGFEYNNKRRRLALAAADYLKRKARIIVRREELAAQAPALGAAGSSPQAMYPGLVGERASQHLVERRLSGGRLASRRIGPEFETFDEFCAQARAGIEDSGMVWATIEAIEPVDFEGCVYDFTVAHPDHNFIANEFVVSNCGVRLLASDLGAEEAEPFLDDLATTLYTTCPSGVGRGGRFRLNDRELDQVLSEGAGWCLRQGLATQHDIVHTEEQGGMPEANPARVSARAHERGREQLGTLGAGNHFLEVDRVVATYDTASADAFGLRPGQIVVLIHCGSRGLGHQVCTDYVRDFQRAVARYGIVLPDRELVCAPLDSPEGQAYLAAMRCAANFAFANRQTLAALVRESFERVFAGSGLPFGLRQVYDVAHNMGKIEWHEVGGRQMQVCVHRKGATRAFGPGAGGLPPDYRDVGQPVLVPGSMGTASYVLAGTTGSMTQTFGSTCHGAGRMLSRTAAKKRVRGAEVRQQLNERGIRVRAGSMPGLAEEAPFAYKQVEEVVEVVDRAGIARIVARLEPLAVIKG